MRIALVVIAVLFFAKVVLVFEENGRLKDQIEQYALTLKQERENFIKVQKQSEDLQRKINNLNKYNDSIRLQFKNTLSECTISVPDDITRTTKSTGGRRVVKMGELLEVATALIRERDEIALQYNMLREQCQLK